MFAMRVQFPTELAALACLQAEVRGAHEGMINCLAWHPAGHVIATGSGDCSTKFWCRARPGDPWKDSLQRDQEQHAGSVGEAGDKEKRRLCWTEAERSIETGCTGCNQMRREARKFTSGIVGVGADWTASCRASVTGHDVACPGNQHLQQAWEKSTLAALVRDSRVWIGAFGHLA